MGNFSTASDGFLFRVLDDFVQVARRHFRVLHFDFVLARTFVLSLWSELKRSLSVLNGPKARPATKSARLSPTPRSITDFGVNVILFDSTLSSGNTPRTY